MFIPFGKNHKNKSQKNFFSNNGNPVTNHFKFTLSVFGIHPQVSTQNTNNNQTRPPSEAPLEVADPQNSEEQPSPEDESAHFLKGVLIGLMALSVAVTLIWLICKKRRKNTQLLAEIRR